MNALSAPRGSPLPWLLAGLALASGAAAYFAGRDSAGVTLPPSGAAAAQAEPAAAPPPLPVEPVLASSSDARGHLFVDIGGAPVASRPGDELPPEIAAAVRPDRETAPPGKRWHRSRATLAFPLEDQRGPMPLSVWLADRSGAPLWPAGESFVREGPTAEVKVWNPVRAREQLLGLLPAGAVEEVTRPFVERRIQVRIQRDQAFVTLRIPID